jgi:hypothetical protein
LSSIKAKNYFFWANIIIYSEINRHHPKNYPYLCRTQNLIRYDRKTSVETVFALRRKNPDVGQFSAADETLENAVLLP